MTNKFSRHYQAPLHLAVLQDDFAAINLLKANPELLSRKNGLGFTAIELASLLGKQKALELLQPKIYPPIAIQIKESDEVGYYSRQQFEKQFGIKYLQTPYFENLQLLEKLIQNSPWLLSHTIVGREHNSLGSFYRKALFNGELAELAIKWISDKMGYGLFAQNFIAKESFIGQYTGIVRNVSRFKREHNPYCMHIPTKFWSFHYFLLDAKSAGNEMRFANHSNKPAMKLYCLLDRSLVHIGLFALRNIEPGEELTFNYFG